MYQGQLCKITEQHKINSRPEDDHGFSPNPPACMINSPESTPWDQDLFQPKSRCSVNASTLRRSTQSARLDDQSDSKITSLMIN
jgi:hypothetical protein